MFVCHWHTLSVGVLPFSTQRCCSELLHFPANLVAAVPPAGSISVQMGGYVQGHPGRPAIRNHPIMDSERNLSLNFNLSNFFLRHTAGAQNLSLACHVLSSFYRRAGMSFGFSSPFAGAGALRESLPAITCEGAKREDSEGMRQSGREDKW